MVNSLTLYVEGCDDKVFVCALIKHLGISGVKIRRIGGGVSKLAKVKQQILRSHDEGCRIAIVVDADSDFNARQTELLEEMERLELPVFDFFLIPNHRDNGSLETLLIEIAATEHRKLHDCFTQYEECLRQCRSAYALPALKGKVYAYSEALGILQEEDRGYSDSRYWNLDASILDQLKDFLRRNAE